MELKMNRRGHWYIKTAPIQQEKSSRWGVLVVNVTKNLACSNNCPGLFLCLWVLIPQHQMRMFSQMFLRLERCFWLWIIVFCWIKTEENKFIMFINHETLVSVSLGSFMSWTLFLLVILVSLAGLLGLLDLDHYGSKTFKLLENVGIFHTITNTPSQVQREFSRNK